MERTIEETEKQEECDRDNYRQTLNVDNLDRNKCGSREHNGCDGKASQAINRRNDFSICENSPVGIGKVGGVFEGGDDDYGHDHHWEMR